MAVTNGLTSIMFSNILAVPVWAKFGDTTTDSFAFAPEEGTTTDFTVEEKNAPILSRTSGGKDVLTFRVANPDTTQLQAMFGGTITGDVWSAPTAKPYIEKMVRITPDVGYEMNINKASVSCVFTGGFGKNVILEVEVTVTILDPGVDENDDPIPPYTLEEV